MNKIIIHHDIDDLQATYYVMKVIQQGKISKGGTQYCYITTFTNGVAVHADLTKTGTPVFHVQGTKE